MNPAEIEAREIEAFLLSLARSVVGIVGKYKGEFGKGIGTGTLVLLEGLPCILTAAHVIHDSEPGELRFFMPGQIEIQEHALGDLPRVRPTDVLPREPLNIRSLRQDFELDAALIELSDIYLQHQTLTFREIEKPGVFPRPLV
jgi:hypothetical protein